MIKVLKRLTDETLKTDYDGKYCYAEDYQTIIYAEESKLKESYILSEVKNGMIVVNKPFIQ